jgi:hypothetical protein
MFDPQPLAVGYFYDAALRRAQVSKSDEPDGMQAGVIQGEPSRGRDRR